MDDRDKQHIEEHEADFNPAPKTYRVSFTIKLLFIVVAALGVGGYFYIIKTRREAESKFLLENSLATTTPNLPQMPPLMAYDLKLSQEIDMAAKTGTWVLLNIWATWCPPCREEMPSLELLQQKLKGRLNIIALSVDENIDAVKEFVAVNQPSFSVMWDNSQQASMKFGITKYPETFLINPQGHIIAQMSGPRDWASARALEYLLNVLK